MAEEQVISLLEEIRDLQKLHIENYRDALKIQQESVDLHKKAVRRQRVTSLVMIVLLAVFLIVLVWSSHPAAG